MPTTIEVRLRRHLRRARLVPRLLPLAALCAACGGASTHEAQSDSGGSEAGGHADHQGGASGSAAAGGRVGDVAGSGGTAGNGGTAGGGAGAAGLAGNGASAGFGGDSGGRGGDSG